MDKRRSRMENAGPEEIIIEGNDPSSPLRDIFGDIEIKERVGRIIVSDIAQAGGGEDIRGKGDSQQKGQDCPFQARGFPIFQ